PPHFFGLITGFLEKGESPETGVVREVKEELGIDCTINELVGNYPFHRMNQVIMAYQVEAPPAEIILGEELAAYKSIPIDQLRPWPYATGDAVADWLASRGFNPERIDLRSFRS
ncbi:MAG: NUDIX domain-containing protein, partial [Bacteroidota bacterium]